MSTTQNMIGWVEIWVPQENWMTSASLALTMTKPNRKKGLLTNTQVQQRNLWLVNTMN